MIWLLVIQLLRGLKSFGKHSTCMNTWIHMNVNSPNASLEERGPNTITPEDDLFGQFSKVCQKIRKLSIETSTITSFLNPSMNTITRPKSVIVRHVTWRRLEKPRICAFLPICCLQNFSWQFAQSHFWMESALLIGIFTTLYDNGQCSLIFLEFWDVK